MALAYTHLSFPTRLICSVRLKSGDRFSDQRTENNAVSKPDFRVLKRHEHSDSIGPEILDMPSAIPLRTDFSAQELRLLARKSSTVSQSRRLLSLAAVLEGKSRTEAARIGGMDRQTLCDWAHRFNALGPEGLLDNWTAGPTPRLNAAQKEELAEIVEKGPDREKDGVVRWRRVDLQRVICERFGVQYCERRVGSLLKELGFSHISARPRKI